MQIFVPYPDSYKTAECLDSKRLFKQVLEAQTIMKIITGEIREGGWVNHPATKMWYGCQTALASYGVAITSECFKRGIKNSLNYHRFFLNYFSGDYRYPFWWGDETVHSSHRSRLLFKGRIDLICVNIKNFFKLKNINDWLKKKGFPAKNFLKHDEVEFLEKEFLLTCGPIQGMNHYVQFGWTEDDKKSYVWKI